MTIFRDLLKLAIISEKTCGFQSNPTPARQEELHFPVKEKKLKYELQLYKKNCNHIGSLNGFSSIY